jgi:hypothetical protein
MRMMCFYYPIKTYHAKVTFLILVAPWLDLFPRFFPLSGQFFLSPNRLSKNLSGLLFILLEWMSIEH